MTIPAVQEAPVEIEQLRHFVRVAEMENFTRAAEQVGLSQPALSRSIARLEDELGQPLFERQSRKVALTEAGRLLLERARTILMLVADVTAEIGDDGQSGKVRVAAIPTVAPYLLPDCLRSFHQLYPRAQLIVLEDTTEHLLKKVAEGDIDVAICALPIGAKYVEVEPLFDEELLLVLGRDHPLAGAKTVRVADLADLPFVLLGEAHCLTDNVVSFCRQKSLHPVSVEQTNQLSMVQELVALGHGVSLIPAMARARDTGTSRVYRSLAGQKPVRTLAMVTNPYRYRSHIVRRFTEHLRAWRPAKG
ncbi:MAG: LysR family transcriptional regulator [Gemmataceae bacterium]|nr:LysR family transcriptional regulator [Gemmataceae bacterium]